MCSIKNYTMSLQEFFDEFSVKYNKEWFDLSKEKFLAHPSNENRSPTIEITIYDLEEASSGNPWTQYKTINLFDFLKGANDDYFADAYYYDQEQNIEITGIDEEKNEIIENISGKSTPPLSSFYPTPNFSEWETKITKEIKACLDLLNSLQDKEVFFDFVLLLVKEQKALIKGLYVDEHLVCLNTVLDEIATFTYKISDKIIGLQTVIGNFEKKIEFEITQSQLSRLIYLLIEKGLINPLNSHEETLKLFSKYCLVKHKTTYVNPNSLSSAFRRLTSIENSASNKKWADSVNLEL